MNIVETAGRLGNFRTLLKALKSLDFFDLLEGSGPFTLFAPTDEAFARMPASTIEVIFKDNVLLNDVLTFHLINGLFLKKDIASRKQIKSANGKFLSISDNGTKLRVDGAVIIKSDIECTNGVVHIIDTVILPKEIRPAEAVHIKKIN